MKTAVFAPALGALVVSVLTQSPAPNRNAAVASPDGYRTWAHVKSSVISPSHQSFAVNGGFQHIYANAEAMRGYQSRDFPDGSVIAFEWLAMTDTQGAYAEGARRQLDVMVKNAAKYQATGGWGFQRFMKDSQTELSTTLLPDQCYACHDKLKKDGLVLSSYRR